MYYTVSLSLLLFVTGCQIITERFFRSFCRLLIRQSAYSRILSKSLFSSHTSFNDKLLKRLSAPYGIRFLSHLLICLLYSFQLQQNLVILVLKKGLIISDFHCLSIMFCLILMTVFLIL